jgi:hypothetical protein
MDEGIAPREPNKEILILDVVDRNMQMLEATSEWIVLLELPF